MKPSSHPEPVYMNLRMHQQSWASKDQHLLSSFEYSCVKTTNVLVKKDERLLGKILAKFETISLLNS